MRALDHVVHRLRPLRVPGQSAALTQPRKVLTPREELVHVRLMSGIEDDGVIGRVKHPMDRDAQLDDTEVGAEMPAGLGDGRHQKAPDLVGEPGQLVGRQAI